MAFEVAKKAERALQHELGDPTARYIDGAYLAGREGLFAGEKLHLDLKRMELAYHELNQREYELTKHVSLMQFAPEALVALRATGKCQLVVPEEVFDLDGPGHYFRRIKTVAVSVPCIVGPYTNVGCKLVLLKSQVRRTAAVGDDGYASTGPEDARFSTYYGGIQSVVTSSSQNDSGMFEANLRDERYLPFEGSGAISTWSLELPAEVPQFDLDTIADVVLHIRYTAREGGELLRKAAVGNVRTLLAEARSAGSARLFSVRHEFPEAWARFKQVQLGGTTTHAELSFELLDEHYPFWSRDSLEAVHQLELFAKSKKAVKLKAPGSATEDTLGEQLGELRVGLLTNVPRPAPTGKVIWLLSDNTISDLFFVTTCGKAP
jgi:Tc toxin complex TcA C-terminal TcB-binding domain